MIKNITILSVALLGCLCAIPYEVSAQSSSVQIDSLEKIANTIKDQIISLQAKLDSVNNEISLSKYQDQQQIQLKASKNGLPAVINSNVTVRQTPSALGQPIAKISSGTRIMVYSYSENYLRIEFDGVIGWVNSGFVTNTQAIKDLIESYEETRSAITSNALSIGAINSNKPQKYTTKNTRRSKSPTYSPGRAHVKGHYRTVNGKKVWVKSHYRNN